MMIKRSEQQQAADPVTQAYEDLETQILQNIIRHVKNYGQLIDSDEWLMQKLAEIGKLNQENIRSSRRRPACTARRWRICAARLRIWCSPG